jgi:hypothetical protein
MWKNVIRQTTPQWTFLLVTVEYCMGEDGCWTANELFEHTVISGCTALLASSQQLRVREIAAELALLRLTDQILGQKDVILLGQYFPTF